MNLKTAILACHLMAVTLFSASAQSEEFPSETKPNEAEWKLHLGARVQRQRIVDFRNQVAAMSVPDLENALAEPVFIVRDAGLLGSGLELVNQLTCVLADRRVAKLYAAYQVSGAEEASRQAEALFEKWILEHEDRLQRVMEQYAVTGGIEITIGTEYSHHAVASSVFLMTQFCPAPKVVKALKRWQDIGAVATEKVYDQHLKFSPLHYEAGPCELLLLNLSLVSLQQIHKEPQEFLAVVEEHLKFKEHMFRKVPYLAWDAETNPFDFTHLHKGVPYDDSKVLTHIRYVRAWGSIPTHRREYWQTLSQSAFKLLEVESK